MEKIKVGINGYGVIGKRIADAVLLQDDMQLVGVTARTPDFRLFPLKKLGISLYGVDGDACQRLMGSNFGCKGDANNLFKQVDVIVDATPKGIGAKNKEKYDQFGIKSIYQGGEEHALTGFSFVAEVNYTDAIGKQSLRVVSCNTTAICRITYPFVKEGVLDAAHIALARRGADPVDSHEEGPLGTIKLEDQIPSHQGSDAKTIIPSLNIVTAAFSVPTTLGHLHIAFLRLNKELSKEDVVNLLKSSPRVVPVRHKDGLIAQNQLVEFMRDLKRPRADMWEVAFWEDSLYVYGLDVTFYYQVHNEAIVIPENIDAIRAMSGSEKESQKSIDKTDNSLGIVKEFAQSS